MTALSVMDPAGEIIRAVDAGSLLAAAGIQAVSDAETTQLAEFDENARLLTDIAKEARGAVSDELVRRLDRNGRWTLREGGYEIKSSSPEAGTVGYDTDALRDALHALVADDVISAQGATAALEVIPAPCPMPYDDLHLILAALDGTLDQPGYLALRESIAERLLGEPEPRLVQHPVGIKSLLKIPAAREAIEACAIELQPPRRRATVKPLPIARTR